MTGITVCDDVWCAARAAEVDAAAATSAQARESESSLAAARAHEDKAFSDRRFV